MSSARLTKYGDPKERYEYLSGRFFDGALSDSEDRELADLLNQNEALAVHFINAVRLERLAIGASGARRLDDESFAAAVLRSLELSEDETGSQKFADEIVQLVRARARRRSHARISIVRRRNEMTAFSPVTIIGVCAAMLFLALLLALSKPAPMPADNTAYHVEAVNLKHKTFADNDTASASPAPAVPPRDAKDDKPRAAAESPAPPVEISEPVEIAREQPAPPPAKNVAAASKPAPAVPKTPATALGSVGSFAVAKVLCARDGGEPRALKSGEALYEGDKVSVTLPDTSPGDNAGADILLKDGSVLRLQPGSALVLHAENSAQRPLLENGELLAHIKPQTNSPLVIATRQGAEAAVLGTVFRLSADAQNKRVALCVEEGKVQFSSNGEKCIVTADQMAVADGKTLTSPAYYRPRPAAVTGIVTDKETGRPLVDAIVSIAPLAERKASPRHIAVKTDAEGKFTIEGLPEGNVFVFAKTNEGGSVGLIGRAVVSRVKLIGGEKMAVNLAVDRAMLCAGRVTENGRPISDYRVRMVSANGDGQTMKVELASKIPAAEYRTVAFDAPGRYTAVVERPGFISRIKSARINELRPDRVTVWNIDAQSAPSAVIKGRITSALSGAAITDERNASLDDPHQPRTIVSLTTPWGFVQSVVAESDGEFTFDTNLDSGQYEIKAERFGYAPALKRFSLAAGQKIELDVPLEFPKPPARPKPAPSRKSDE